MFKKIIIYFIVIISGIHVLNWDIKGIGWRGNKMDKFQQIITLPWSLI